MSMSDPPNGLDVAEWAGRLLVVLQFGLLAWMAWRAWNSPFELGIMSLSLLAASTAMAFWALAANRPGNFNVRPTPRPGGSLVTTGPYRWVRHPMYTSVLLAAAGVAVLSHRSVDVVLWLALLGVLAAKAGIEERALMTRFAGYRHYMTQTTRFLPWLV